MTAVPDTPYPLIFEPILKHRVWGGRRLARLGKPLPPDDRIGESWEIADIPDSPREDRTTVANGPLRGRTLAELLAADRRWLMGDAPKQTFDGEESGETFPLLIKYLDATDNLSVQVHPSPHFAAEHPGSHVKSEAWIIVDADPDAVLYKGVKPGVTRREFTDALRDPTDDAIVRMLRAVPARPGDCHYLPSGLCHALGAGIVVAEVQTPSDTTFRLYDWGRRGRELHIDDALACMTFADDHHTRHSDPSPPAPGETTGPVWDADGMTTTRLAKTPHFQIERIDVESCPEMRIATSNQPMVWMVLAGRGEIDTPDAGTVHWRPGTTVLIPAALRDAPARFDGPATILQIHPPSPTQGMIA